MSLLCDFKCRFPEFASIDADKYIPILEQVWPAYYGGAYPDDKEIILNLLAHLMVVEQGSGSGNIKSMQSKSVGNVSVSYTAGVSTQSERTSWFSTTKYGSRFLLLTRRRQGAVFV